MHEMSLCENIRDILEGQAQTGGFTRVNKVWLEVGPLSCVEPEALRFGFDVVMRGSVAEGATLDIATPRAMAQCPACHRIAEVKQRFEACPDCGSPALQVTRGDEFRIIKLEVV